MDPNFPLAIFYTARCYELDSQYEQAITEYKKAVTLSGGSSLALAGLGHVYAQSGRLDQGRAVLHELTAMSQRRYVSPYPIGTEYAGLGENDKALEWLEKARLEHDYSLVLLKWMPGSTACDKTRVSESCNRTLVLRRDQQAVRIPKAYDPRNHTKLHERTRIKSFVQSLFQPSTCTASMTKVSFINGRGWLRKLATLISLCSLCSPALARDAAVKQVGVAAQAKLSGQSQFQWNNSDGSKGRGIEHSSLLSKSMGVEVGYNVYLPPGYAAGKQRYPAIYFLHGAGGNENSDAEGFASLIRRAIEEGKIRPVICIFPNGGMSGYIDESCPKLRYERFFIEELLPHIDATYRTINSRKGRAIAGFSMGGGGALGLALKHPDLFSAAASWAAGLLYSCPDAAPVYDPAPHDLFLKLAKQSVGRISKRIRLLLVVGDKDPTHRWQKLFSDQLAALRIVHQFRVLPGVSHNLRVYHEQTGAEVVQFLSGGLAASGSDRQKRLRKGGSR